MIERTGGDADNRDCALVCQHKHGPRQHSSTVVYVINPGLTDPLAGNIVRIDRHPAGCNYKIGTLIEKHSDFICYHRFIVR